MRGRSRITFQKKQNDILHHDDANDDNDDFDNKVKWLKKIAGQHAKLGNKLIATAKRIKAAGYHKDEVKDSEVAESGSGSSAERLGQPEGMPKLRGVSPAPVPQRRDRATQKEDEKMAPPRQRKPIAG